MVQETYPKGSVARIDLQANESRDKRLNDMQDLAFQHLDVHIIQEQLETKSFGRSERICYQSVLDSTNTHAMTLAREGVEEGTIVLADSQVAGRGRLGRRWIDVAGWNVLSSTVLRPSFSPHLLVMIASLAVVRTILDLSTLEATIKWPNDVLVAGHKVAGILIETSHDQDGRLVAILGIGVNVNGHISQSVEAVLESQVNAISLEDACGHTLSRERFIARMLKYIEQPYLALQREVQEAGFDTTMTATAHMLREQWRNRLSTLGQLTRVRQGNRFVTGIAEDVNEQGELLLREPAGDCITITWGEIQ
jgi:BirA family transcriptional regulator, biotin operon repressor / biotin---[acetyl-CoA-carboxylase] ligase